MTAVAGTTFGILGPLAAFPQRLAAREIARKDGVLRRAIGRRTSHVIVGRRFLAKADDAAIERRIESARQAGKALISENGLLRRLGLMREAESPAMPRRSLLDQSGLGGHDFDLLALFDAFEHDREPFSFRDLILARKYAGLIAAGATWGTVARSVHRSPDPVAALTAVSLHAGRPDAVYARRGDALSELDGQMLLPIDDPGGDQLEDLFAAAEEAEDEGRFEEAAALYRRCLVIDPLDSTAAFNCATCLYTAGRTAEAKAEYLRTIKLDPGFVEAWFNFACMLSGNGETDAARRYFVTAIGLDPDYADAVYNLATLEFDAGRLAEARRWWTRYLELDRTSDWARNARRGIRYIEMSLARRSAR